MLPIDTAIAPASPVAGGTAATISTVVRNLTDYAGTCDVRCYIGSVAAENMIAEQIGVSVAAHNHTTLSNIVWDTTNLDGVFNVIVQIENLSAIESSPANNQVTIANYEVMTIPPVISNIHVNTYPTSATIMWDTDKRSTSHVEYGLDATYGSWSSNYTQMVTSHSVGISGLTPEYVYHYRIHSIDPVGHEGISEDRTFIAAPDVTPPDTWFTGGPGNGTACAVPVNISWNGWDNESGYGLTFSYRVDDGSWSAFTTDKSTSVALTDGSHSFAVRAKDQVGNIDASPVSCTFTVDTTDPIISSVASAPLKKSATITWTTDSGCTSQVEYGITTDYGSTSSLNGSFVTNHSVQLTGLNSTTIYNYSILQPKSSTACIENPA